MRVAVLTQPLGANYGGIMQAWALQKALRQMGHRPLVVDRHFPERSDPVRRRIGALKRLIDDARLGVQGRASYWRHAPSFRQPQQDFIQGNIERSPELRTDAELRRFFKVNHFDAIIVGSDQVWRPRYSPSLETYFLNFLGAEDRATKRLAYAASFGVSDWELSEDQTLACRALAQRFSGISVREKSGVHLCAEHLGVAAEWVADPTLLHPKDIYVQEFCDPAAGGGKGLLTYILDQSPEKAAIVDKLEGLLGLRRFRRQPMPATDVVKRSDLGDYRYPPANAWVNGFHECDFVVTDSFHGVLFSIIFGKPFVAIANPDRGIERFRSILDLAGLGDRLVHLGAERDLVDLAAPVDFEGVEARMAPFRSASLAFLERHLGSEL